MAVNAASYRIFDLRDVLEKQANKIVRLDINANNDALISDLDEMFANFFSGKS
jgi:hypothetical protein